MIFMKKTSKIAEMFDAIKKAKVVGLDRFLLQLQSETKYSIAVLKRLGFYYGFERMLTFIQALKRPSPFLALRVNTLKTSVPRVLAELKSVGIQARPSKVFEDVILVPIKGPEKLPIVEKKVVVKDKAGEEVMLGANLYAEGVVEMDPTITRGDPVNIVTKYGDIIAYGRATASAGTALKGQVVEVEKSLWNVPKIRVTRPWIRGYIYFTTLASRQAHEWLKLEDAKNVLLVTPAPDDVAHVIQEAPENANIVVISKTQLEEYRLKSNLQAMKINISRIQWHVIDYKYIHLQPGYYDAIAVRPRCSKTGIRPRISCFLKEEDIISLAKTALMLLQRLIPALKKEGQLLMINTSLDPLEGEIVLSELIGGGEKEIGINVELADVKIKWGDKGLTIFPVGSQCMRTYPDKHDLGLFAALLVRR